MKNSDERIDAYIGKSQDFAKPVLNHLRRLVHEVCPNVEETMKWSFPHFNYKGMMCSMASFKQHCAFGFWKTSLMNDPEGILPKDGEREGMGSLGKLTSLEDLPSDEILRIYIAEAMRLNDEDVKKSPKPKAPAKEIVVPPELLEELARNEAAAATFDGFPPSCKREYVDWITEAKTEATRNKRLAQTVEWLAEGKRRNWKYENC